MNNKRKIISLILTIVLIMSFTTFAFADGEDDGTGSERINQVTAGFDYGDDGVKNTCLKAGTVTLTNPSGRTLAIEGETLAYHVVDTIGFTLYLERKPSSTGIISTVQTYKYSVDDARRAYNAYGKTVTQSGYYRLRAYFRTEHSTHGVEGDSASTTWMWID